MVMAQTLELKRLKLVRYGGDADEERDVEVDDATTGD